MDVIFMTDQSIKGGITGAWLVFKTGNVILYSENEKSGSEQLTKSKQ